MDENDERARIRRAIVARLKATTLKTFGGSQPRADRALARGAMKALDDDADVESSSSSSSSSSNERTNEHEGEAEEDGEFEEKWFAGDVRGTREDEDANEGSANEASERNVGDTSSPPLVDRQRSKSPIVYGMEKLPQSGMSVPEDLKEYIGVGSGREAKRARYRCPCEHASSLRRYRRRSSSDTEEFDFDSEVEHAPGCASHALMMFWRSFTAAYMTRAGISVAAHAIRTLRGRKPSRIFDISHLVGESALRYREEAVRFGLFAGLFVGGYNATRCGLCYASASGSTADDAARNRSKSSSERDAPSERDASKATTSAPTVLGRRKPFTPESAALYAGGIAGLSIFFLKPKLRRTVSLYMLAKLAQAGFESAKKDNKWLREGPGSWEHGNVLLFTLSSAQVMYAYVMRPDTLDAGFWNFIVRSGPIDKPTLAHLRQSASRLPAPVSAVAKAVCSDHAMLHSSTGAVFCTSHVIKSAVDTFQKCVPFYFSIHFVPYVVLNFAKAIKKPMTTLFRATRATVRSTTFISTYVAVYMSVVCAHRNAGLPNHRSLYYIAGIVAGGALLVENKSRRTDLALWLMPRALDSLVLVMLHKGILPHVPNFDSYVFAVVMGATMSLYEREPDTLEPNLRAFIARFVEPPGPSRKFTRNSSVGFM